MYMYMHVQDVLEIHVQIFIAWLMMRIAIFRVYHTLQPH